MTSPANRSVEGARRRLEGVVDDLLADLGSIAASTAETPDDEHDAEGSTVGYERARVGALLRQAQSQLRVLDQAAQRVEDGTYGRCADCGAGIDAERLEALPGTWQCVSCAAGRAAPSLGAISGSGPKLL